jgi:hypothetical protein
VIVKKNGAMTLFEVPQVAMPAELAQILTEDQ